MGRQSSPMEDGVVVFDVDRDAEEGCDGDSSDDGVGNVLLSECLIKSNGGGDGVGQRRGIGRGRESVVAGENGAGVWASSHDRCCERWRRRADEFEQ
jgi:hypothetical protein